MILVTPGTFGRTLQWQRQGGARVGAKLLHLPDAFRASGRKTRPQPRQVRPFRQGMKDDHPLGIRPGFAGDLQRARGRNAPINLRVAFIRKDLEIVFFRQLEQRGQIIPRGDGPLGVRGRADIGDTGAVQHRRRQRGIVGQKTGFGRGRDENRLRRGGQGGDRIDLIERVGRQHHWLLPRFLFRAKRETGVEKPLARSVQGKYLPLWIHLDPVTPCNPPGDGGAQLWRSLVGGIAAEFMGMLGDHLPHPCGKGVARLTDGHVDDLSARLMRGEQAPETRERVWRQL